MRSGWEKKRQAVLGLASVLLVAACGKFTPVSQGGSNGDTSGQSLALQSSALKDYPTSITMLQGQVSTDQPIAVLSVKDEAGRNDTWARYRDFTPGPQGLDARLNFDLPPGIDPASTGVSFTVNYMGWQSSVMLWTFSLYDYSQGAWVKLGDNSKASSWYWTALTFSAPGPLSHYVSNGQFALQFGTASGQENAHLDYVAALLSPGVFAHSAPVATATPTATATPAGNVAPTAAPTTIPPVPTAAATLAPTAAPTNAPTHASGVLPGTGRIPAGTLYGLTLDSIDNLPPIVQSLGKLTRFPTSRIVFDEGNASSYYTDAVAQIRPLSYIMGEILDSQFVTKLSTSAYLQRANQYWSQYGNQVDIWEVGNEVNGEWLGNTSDVVTKISSAYDLIHGAGGVTELTLYYNQGCYASADHEMFTWAAANIPDRMKQGLDYVLISYYEDDCNGLQPDWPTVYAQLAQMFPNSRVGQGECGTTKAANKTSYINRYYSQSINVPHFIGGYFWWYGSEDLVPYTSSYWSVFNLVTGTH